MALLCIKYREREESGEKFANEGKREGKFMTPYALYIPAHSREFERITNFHWDEFQTLRKVGNY